MSDLEKLKKIAEIMDIGADEIAPDTLLNSLSYWDSLTKLSLIVMASDDFGKDLTGATIRSFVTIQDVMNFLG